MMATSPNEIVPGLIVYFLNHADADADAVAAAAAVDNVDEDDDVDDDFDFIVVAGFKVL